MPVSKTRPMQKRNIQLPSPCNRCLDEIYPSREESPDLEAALGVGVGDAVAALDIGLADGGAGGGGELLVLGQGVGRVEVLVDDTSHAVLAVVACSLAAVVPDRGAVLDDDLEDLGVLALGSGEESGEEGLSARRLAGLTE